ncbi:MAG: hypothetical protein JJ979_21430 [Roseibium sp.]|nr:hypothetical protein [Roseibium sp.]
MNVGFHKVVSALPGTLEADSVYYVRVGAGVDMYVTNSSGEIVAYGSNVPAHSHAWSDITGKPSTFNPSSHTHAWSQVTGKPSTYAPSSHTHSIANVTGLQSALDGKLATSGVAANSNQLGGVAASSYMRPTVGYNITATWEFQDNHELRFGNSADMRLRHNGSHSYIENYTGNLHIIGRSHGGEVKIGGEKSDGVYRDGFIYQDGLYCRLLYDGAEKMRTDGSGVTVYGRLHADDRMYIGKNGGGDSWLDFYDDNTNTWRTFGWDDSRNEFMLEENNGNWVAVGGGFSKQTWQTPSRNFNTTYQNTTGRPIMITVAAGDRSASDFQVSTNGSSWSSRGRAGGNSHVGSHSFIVPDGLYYRMSGGTKIMWHELR